MAALAIRRPKSIGIALCLAAFAAILCVAYNKILATAHIKGDENISANEAARVDGRFLLNTISDDKLMEDVDSEAIRNAALSEEYDNGIDAISVPKLGQLHPYTLLDAIREADIWSTTFAIIIYDPERDTFVGLYSKTHRWDPSCRKLWTSVDTLANMLRTVFPERFQGSSSDEFAIAIGSGDYPEVKISELPYKDGVAPVLQFGSVFRDRSLYPNMIPMPMPGEHLGCFEQWSRERRSIFGVTVCDAFRPMMDKVPHGQLVFGNEFHLEWDDLIPQLIWRGTDFTYLPTLRRPREQRPLNNYMEKFVENRKLVRTGMQKKKLEATRALRRNYNKLLPRWKGVVLTAESELEVDLGQGQRKLPWANIKFSRFLNGGALPSTIGSDKYKQYDEVGIATGNFMGRLELAKYKYQIDLGGGGGTTWMGTIEKLAMPGVLFHHVTPTKDYIHDRLKPWRHYIPVAPDLSDLREKFDWAESHPQQAKKIADQATAFVRNLGTQEGFVEIFEDEIVDPLRRIIEAYQPVSSSHPGMTWKDVLALESSEGSKMVPIVECNGITNNPVFCGYLGGDAFLNWVKQGLIPIVRL